MWIWPWLCVCVADAAAAAACTAQHITFSSRMHDKRDGDRRDARKTHDDIHTTRRFAQCSRVCVLFVVVVLVVTNTFQAQILFDGVVWFIWIAIAIKSAPNLFTDVHAIHLR